MKKVKKAFTLVELLVVIAIIAILAAIVVPKAFTAIEKSKVSRTLSDMKAFKTAVLQFYADVGFFPGDVGEGTDPGLGCGKDDLSNIQYKVESLRAMGFANQAEFLKKVDDEWQGPYLDVPLSKKTAWGGVYDYECWPPTSDNTNNNSNGIEAGIYITIHGVTEKGAEQLVKQSPFEVGKGKGKYSDGIQDDDVSPDKKKVTLKIADWPY
ncbi:prepilin-type N-terminal cleavage/methylation domain-containing protein [Clostridium mobile]|nr:prepilin-type N-terminal cleavage/methylation domain-containing protein [Clostridium mobile]